MWPRLFQAPCQEYSRSINQTCLSELFHDYFVRSFVLGFVFSRFFPLFPSFFFFKRSPGDEGLRRTINRLLHRGFSAAPSSCWRHETLYHWTRTWKCWRFFETDWKRRERNKKKSKIYDKKKKRKNEHWHLLLHRFWMLFYSCVPPAFCFSLFVSS